MLLSLVLMLGLTQLSVWGIFALILGVYALTSGLDSLNTRLSQAATAFATEMAGGTTREASAVGASAGDMVFDAHISHNHLTVSSMYEEWYGLGQYENRPCPGGFHMLETNRKAKRRTGYEQKELLRFNKIKRIMDSIRGQTEQGRVADEVLKKYDGWWSEVGLNPSNMIEQLLSEQHLHAKARRKRKRNSSDDDN